MSRKNKTLRAFLHQTRNPTIEQAWDTAWGHAQKAFHARSMQDMEKQVADLQAECEKLRKDAERYRWLRSQSSPATVMLFGVDEGLALDGMDEAIDAAIVQDVEIFEVIVQQEAYHDIQ